MTATIVAAIVIIAGVFPLGVLAFWHFAACNARPMDDYPVQRRPEGL